MKATKACLYLEIDGAVCIAVLSNIDAQLIVDVVSTLTESGKLSVVKLPDGFKFDKIENIINEKEVEVKSE